MMSLRLWRMVGKVWVVVAAAAGTMESSAAELSDDMKVALITKLTPHMLAQSHYRQTAFDDKISSLAFDEYFKLLDPQKNYFTQQDLTQFEQYRYALDDLTNNGNSKFAFDVYNLYIQRVGEFKAFAEEMLKSPLSFTDKETLETDRRNAPYCKDMDELKEFWRKRLKNEVLFSRLANRMMEYEKTHPEINNKEMSEEDIKKKETTEEVEKLWRRSPEEQVLRRLRDVNNSVSQSDRTSVLGTFLTAIARSYGPHSDYLAPVVDENFDISMKLSLYGIGATLTADDGYVRVVEIVPGSPAAKEGTLKAGDRIIAVAQGEEEPVDVVDMALDKVVKLVRGEEGSKVVLTVLPGRSGRNALPEYVSIVRGKVELKDSEASGKVYEVDTPDGKAKLGVIKLDSFYMDFDEYLAGNKNYKSCTRDVKNILKDFRTAGVQGVVMDMRSNGGGSLPEAITLSGLFIEDGPIVQIRRQNKDIVTQNDPDDDILFNGPLVVLTSRFTSSAAEIFSGAMKDYQRGLLMGDSRTYGKGTVLEVTKLERILQTVKMAFPAGSLKYECAVFYRVNGDSTQAKGIPADIVFPSFSEHMEIGEEFSSNHLPWDSIAAAEYKVFDPDFEEKKLKLAAAASDRMEHDGNVKLLRERVAKVDEIRNRAEISLNEEERFAEYLANADAPEMSDDGLTIPEGRDLLLNEALNVLTDWLELDKTQK